MGRQKSTPKKKTDGWQYRDTGFVPVIKKRSKTKRRFDNNYNIFNVPLPTNDCKHLYVGKLCVGHTNNVLPVVCTECEVSFNENTEDETQDTILLKFSDCSVLIRLTIDVDFLKEIITTKMFAFDFHVQDEDVYIKLYFQTLPLLKFNNKISNCIKTVFSLLYNVSAENTEVSAENCDKRLCGNSEITNIYKNISSLRNTELVLAKIDVQHSRLKPELRPYQADAVRWMIHRESANHSQEDRLHPLYTAVTLESGVEIYYNKYTGFIDVDKPLIAPSSRGGILADEMGLGKTVEVLACVLNHAKPEKLEQFSEDEEDAHGVLVHKSAKRRSRIFDSSSEDEDACDDYKYSASSLKELSDDDGGESNQPIVVRQAKKRKLPVEKPNRASLLNETKKIKVPNDWVKGTSKKSVNRIALEMWYQSTLNELSTTRPAAVAQPSVQCICGSTSEEDGVGCVKCGKIQHKACLGYKKSYGDYKCPQCWMDEPLIESCATLIVTPVSLRTQWGTEICKHINGNLKVLQYDGFGSTPVYPTQLNTYDLVITTYSVLQAELRLTETGQIVSLRNKRKYSPPGSPLIRIHWWRLCLDEAQTVETPGRMVSTMAQKLTATYRWAVTGTPISKEISDLFGLIDYLQITPYNDVNTWKYLLYQPYVRGNAKPMSKFLSKVLWRSSKADVLNQINIPQQTFQEHVLEFSAVEKFFYKREHELTCDLFVEKAQGYDSSVALEKIDKATLKKLLAPLLSLRQVCTHPNTIRGRYLATKKHMTSMKDLLDALILKNTTDSEESLRLVISASNGLAGIYLLLKRPEAAVEQYRKVLQLTARFSEDAGEVKLTVDKLQVIHAMHNLAEVLDGHPNVPPTLRDGTLRDDCVTVEQKYIEKFINQTATAYEESRLAVATVEKLQEKFVLKDGQWYSDAFDWVSINTYYNDLKTRIETAATNANVASTIRGERHLLMMISNWDGLLNDYRADLYESISKLYEYNVDEEHKIIIKQELVAKAMDCHLRPQNSKKIKTKKCLVCQSNADLKKYESILFGMTKRKISDEGMSLMGSWTPTIEELILKSLLVLLKTRNGKSDLIKDGETHISLIESLKKEFKEIRRFWTFLDQQVCAKDELDICKIRLQLKESNADDIPKENVNKVLKNLSYTMENKLENVHLLSVHELDYQQSLFTSDEQMHMVKLEKNLGTQSYLETLRKQQYEGVSPDPCPICKNALEQHWSILQCGHSYCLECIQLLMKQTFSVTIQCSVCRSKQDVFNISYIKAGHTVTDQDIVNIKGNYSTKIEGVVKLLLELKAQDANVKVLLFSSWIIMLKCLKTALEKNDVTSELAIQSNLEARIETFKDQSKRVTALLLPINLGSKGLNLVEATHVILVEPLLNPADELQAIGRVHRIGQTKATVVHKFLIKNTIEENIYQATTSNADNWDKNKVTLRQLMDLFVSVDEDNVVEAEVIQNGGVIQS